jgi:hypothetical protein
MRLLSLTFSLVALGVVSLVGATAIAGQSAPTWRYTTERDAMRGTSERTACIRAVNRVSLTFPYHPQSPDLCVIEGDHVGRVFLRLPRGGQFLSHEGAVVSIDGGKGQYMPAATAADGSTDILYLHGWAANPPLSPGLADQIVDAKHLVVEVTFYRDGTQQAMFDVYGLKP